jgi:hypothetical protein
MGLVYPEAEEHEHGPHHVSEGEALAEDQE